MKKKMLGLLLATAMGATLLAWDAVHQTLVQLQVLILQKQRQLMRKQKIPVQRQQVSQPGNRRSR